MVTGLFYGILYQCNSGNLGALLSSPQPVISAPRAHSGYDYSIITARAVGGSGVLSTRENPIHSCHEVGFS